MKSFFADLAIGFAAVAATFVSIILIVFIAEKITGH